MTANVTQNGHSGDIKLNLRVNGHIVELAQIAPEHVVARNPMDLSPCDAEVVMELDGKEHRWPVLLQDGMSKSIPRTRILDR